MFQSHEKKLIYFTLAILAFFLLIGALIIYPQFRKIQKINQQIFETRSALEVKYEKTRRLHKSQVRLAEAKKIASDLRSGFIKFGDEIKFISALENLADKYGLDQKLNLSSVSREIGPGLNKVELQIIAKGEFLKLAEYLSALNRHEFLVSISEVSFTRDSPSSLTLSLKANIYVQP